jgi:hypothetical protein
MRNRAAGCGDAQLAYRNVGIGSFLEIAPSVLQLNMHFTPTYSSWLNQIGL